MINHSSAQGETQPGHNEKRSAHRETSKGNKKGGAMPLPLFFGVFGVILGTVFLFASLGAYTQTDKLSVETTELSEQVEGSKQKNDIEPRSPTDEARESQEFISAARKQRLRALTYAVLGLILIASGTLLSQWKVR
jgi:hypothetical protein